mmetsp:Transcript_35739/g.54167  ORF Transcript_35739/g.54167 Transcript_35739/m.54167 type:complete len:87 (+) Transcript_35739:383-643(+)
MLTNVNALDTQRTSCFKSSHLSKLHTKLIAFFFMRLQLTKEYDCQMKKSHTILLTPSFCHNSSTPLSISLQLVGNSLMKNRFLEGQ